MHTQTGENNDSLFFNLHFLDSTMMKVTGTYIHSLSSDIFKSDLVHDAYSVSIIHPVHILQNDIQLSYLSLKHMHRS